MKIHQASQQLSLFFSEADAQEVEPIRQSPVSNGQLLPPSGQDVSHLTQTAPTVVVGNSLLVRSGDPPSPGDSDRHDSTESTADKWTCFLQQHGRVPMISDEKKPWQYRGWLLYYRMLLEDCEGIGRRWDFWCRTMLAGRLLDEPIPQIVFHDSGDREVTKSIERWVHLIDRHRSGWSAVDTLLDWFLWGFGIARHEPQLPPALNETLYRQVNLGPLLLAPHDYLGEWIASHKGNWNPNAFYPTPHSIVEFMVRFTIGGEEQGDKRGKKVLDPAVGSGRMLMHASNYSLRLYGVDIDPALVKVTYINGALYVPWILRPFPEALFTAPETGAPSDSFNAVPECAAVV